ncbi:hypothetical protein J008_04554 [Cryptococcus neoformans]|uniref:Signal peptidase complex subunit 2 n=1 Tax=Cryptococcus neoformans Tu259-1 TaxID=1230072 RepID=A0A854QAA3_CRYNE|nr:hypothetical protein C362_04084 [Cryptococcus neoformans var. grubii Bt1]OWZ37299.1 hypothetical protein C353_04677 [Cryptococcus neoformans var. grubii AD1-83a]OWZ66008.1 hypothetical protein AYX14_06055 [Cryptococcus neoformans var. grubii]OXC83356.1 hypothetical protein C344_04502 [Cryptococcus neoformans var. grubii AD1-7a]OXG16619.1 hypothetical protein C361_04990 [Cryptococcus neoformans var. grubii Tu259-1]OXG35938.1 hypothetical protein C360_02540 [Cryptococcus neoformans var. grubi
MAKSTKTATAARTHSPPPPSDSLMTDPLPTVTVNNANVAEIKSALDDIVKKYLLDQSFTPSLLHPTVHLVLGYASVVLALSSVVYSLRVSFDDSKPVLWAAVVGYCVLQTALWGWKRWVEKDEVFRGKRRRMVKRIETDHLQVVTSSALAAPGPSYAVQLALSTTSNNGKSLIHKCRVAVARGVGELVDADGGVEEGEVKRWLAGVLADAGLVGVEDGLKE